MKGYVYMIDYYEQINKTFKDYDQIECRDKEDLITQCKLLKLLDSRYIVEQIKLVNDKDRWVEKEISKSLYAECKKILKDKLL